METLGVLAQSLSWSFFLIAAVVLLLSWFRAKSIILQGTKRYPYDLLTKTKWLKKIKILYAISWLLFLFGLPNTLFITSPFRRLIPEYITLLLWAALTLMGIVEIIGCRSFSKSLLSNKLKQVSLLMAMLLLGYNAVKQISVGTQLFKYPPSQDSLVLSFPVHGLWSPSEAGGSIYSNYHQGLQAQKYGIDLVKLNEAGSFFMRDGSNLLDHLAFGENVYAPIGGKIVAVIDSLPNSMILTDTFEKGTSLGNHIVIQINPHQFLYLAHLDLGSIQVRKGDEVKAGDFLARVGNSGTTKWPHLHLHIQNRQLLDDENAVGNAIRFDTIEKKRWFDWQDANNVFLLRNDLIRAKSD
jgi:hypothetical protein